MEAEAAGRITERAALLLRALLVVPQGELDDTHFDKLQARLESYAKGAEAEVERFLREGALQTVQVRTF